MFIRFRVFFEKDLQSDHMTFPKKDPEKFLCLVFEPKDQFPGVFPEYASRHEEQSTKAPTKGQPVKLRAPATRITPQYQEIQQLLTG